MCFRSPNNFLNRRIIISVIVWCLSLAARLPAAPIEGIQLLTIAPPWKNQQISIGRNTDAVVSLIGFQFDVQYRFGGLLGEPTEWFSVRYQFHRTISPTIRVIRKNQPILIISPTETYRSEVSEFRAENVPVVATSREVFRKMCLLDASFSLHSHRFSVVRRNPGVMGK